MKMKEHNAIIRVLGDPQFQKKHDSRCSVPADELITRCLDRVTLDKSKDEPLPEWAWQILCYTELPFKCRCRILQLHHMDITGECPNWASIKHKGFVEVNTTKEMDEKFIKFRNEQAKKAEELIAKRKQKETKGK